MSDAASISSLWARFDAWLAAHAPDLATSLRPGATDEQIAATEAVLGVAFPDDVRASYRVHDGQDEDAEPVVPVARELLSLARIDQEWGVWKELLDSGTFAEMKGAPMGPIKTDWWNARWIPLTYDGSGNHDCLDLDPAEDGHVGQMISFWHDEAGRLLEAPSFTAWLSALVDGCEAGRYAYVPDEGLVPLGRDE